MLQQNDTVMQLTASKDETNCPADNAADELFRSGETLRKSGNKAVAIHICKKCGIKHQKDNRRYQRGKEHAFILEKKFAIANKKIVTTCHDSAPPESFLPVAARNTSSIPPFLIS